MKKSQTCILIFSSEYSTTAYSPGSSGFCGQILKSPSADLLAKYLHQVGLLRGFVDYRLDGQLFNHAIAFVLAHAHDAEALVFREPEVEFGAAIGGALRGVRAVEFERGFARNERHRADDLQNAAASCW